MEATEKQEKNTTPRTALLLWGPPGCGKSACVPPYAAATGRDYYCMVVAQEDPVDICGIPNIDAATNCSKRSVPAWWIAACERPTVLLLDEITAGTPEQMAAVLRATDDARELAGHKLHPDTVIIAAANPPEMAAGAARELAAPVLSRFRHRDIDASAAVDYMNGGTGIVLTMPNADPIPGARRIVGEYLNRNREAAMASAEQIAAAVAAQRPYPCPRAWTRAADEEGDITAWHEYIGTHAAAGFVNWFTSMDLPDPREIIAGRDYTVPTRGDAALVTAAALAGILGKNPSAAALECACKWYEKAAQAGQTANTITSLKSIIAAVGTAKVSRHAAALKPYAALVGIAA